MTAPNRISGRTQNFIRASCLSKRRYPDQMTAIAIGMIRAAHVGRALYTYRCGICSGWHLTKRAWDRHGKPLTQCHEKAFI